MTDTSSHLPVCVYCGTPRPADETSCPNCGKAWIDVKVDDTATHDPVAAPVVPQEAEEELEPADGPPVVPPPVPAVDDTGEFDFEDWTLPPEKPRSRARWIIPILLLIAVAIVWGFVFLDWGSSSSTTTIAAATTTIPEVTTTTAAETTTTATEGTTTTVAETTTTTIAFPPPADWAPVGDPIPREDLTLRAEGIGPLDFGTDITEIAGRLRASLGEAESSGVDGLCPPAETYWLQWGELLAIFDSFETDGVFVSYRYEDVGSETELGLTTLSGLALGDTVEDLQRIYSSFTITFEVIDGKDHFRLSDAGELLLWGPVSSTDAAGIVEGIYSPTPCEDS